MLFPVEFRIYPDGTVVHEDEYDSDAMQSYSDDYRTVEVPHEVFDHIVSTADIHKAGLWFTTNQKKFVHFLKWPPEASSLLKERVEKLVFSTLNLSSTHLEGFCQENKFVISAAGRVVPAIVPGSSIYCAERATLFEPG